MLNFAGYFFSLFQGFVMDKKFRKQALRMFSYGVDILISKFEDNYCTRTIAWVSQTSFFKQTTQENGLINIQRYHLQYIFPFLQQYLLISNAKL